MKHEIVGCRSPISIQLRCTCGWTREITRKQNALARARKVRRAMIEHMDEVEIERATAQNATSEK